MSFKEILFPVDFDYSTDSASLPLEFYLEVIPRSKKIYLKLGYFSSSSIQVLSCSFARFIYHGGIIKIITNHYLYEDDIDLMTQKEFGNEKYLSNLEWLQGNLSGEQRHFINCLKYLVAHKRIEIIPVIMKPGRMVHYKQGVFEDFSGDRLAIEGSCNFTASGLVENGESLTVFRSWGSEFESRKIESRTKDVIKIVNKESDKYHYLDESSILNAVSKIGEDKSVEELLKDESLLLGDTDFYENLKSLIEKSRDEISEEIYSINNEPRFPFGSSPREYQQDAYNEWVKANKKGMFAMATGTGKTITSLNCLLQEYLDNGCYQALILVPTRALQAQWINEVKLFNFKSIIPISSKYQGWRRDLRELGLLLSYNRNANYVLIATYASFSGDEFQKLSKNLSDNTLLIADEAHNIGSGSSRRIMRDIRYSKRIGLSATPKRMYDEEGNSAIEEFFNSYEPYTYNFSMERAIEEGYLCRYEYFPHIVSLDDDEMQEYRDITAKIVKVHNGDKGSSSDLVEKLLLARKRIIHRARNKIFEFERILHQIEQERGSLKYTFVYTPEGNDADGNNIMDLYLQSFYEKFSSLRAFPYVSGFENKEIALDDFENGDADVLFSMKCLDEGVDVPRAEIAIFCSSTGNPRQFIQRRGRVLRKHKDKDRAVIHDLVVAPPPLDLNNPTDTERNLLRNELVRVIYFASLADNYYEAMDVCQPIAELYGLDTFALQDELRGS